MGYLAAGMMWSYSMMMPGGSRSGADAKANAQAPPVVRVFAALK